MNTSKKNQTKTPAQVDEARPFGGLSGLGNKIASKLGSVMPNIAAKSSGKIDVGNMANTWMDQYQRWLGLSGNDSSAENLIGWLRDQGLPTSKAEQVIKSVIPAKPGAVPRMEPVMSSKDRSGTPSLAESLRQIMNQLNEDTRINTNVVSKVLLAAAQEYITGGARKPSNQAPATSPTGAPPTQPSPVHPPVPPTSPASDAPMNKPAPVRSEPSMGSLEKPEAVQPNAPTIKGQIPKDVGPATYSEIKKQISKMTPLQKKNLLSYLQDLVGAESTAPVKKVVQRPAD